MGRDGYFINDYFSGGFVTSDIKLHECREAFEQQYASGYEFVDAISLCRNPDGEYQQVLARMCFKWFCKGSSHTDKLLEMAVEALRYVESNYDGMHKADILLPKPSSPYNNTLERNDMTNKEHLRDEFEKWASTYYRQNGDGSAWPIAHDVRHAYEAATALADSKYLPVIEKLQERGSRYESDHPWAKANQEVAEVLAKENTRLLSVVEKLVSLLGKANSNIEQAIYEYQDTQPSQLVFETNLNFCQKNIEKALALAEPLLKKDKP